MLVRMRLEYVTAWPNHAGMFVARKKGFYADRGFDVDIVWDGWDRGTPVDLTVAGEFQFAAVRLGELLETRSTDNPMRALATFNQNQLGGVISLKSKGISSFADLEGKRVSIPPVPRLTNMVVEAMEAQGADFSKVNVLDPFPYEPDIRSVEKGVYDAVFNVLGWESYQGVSPVSEVVQLSFDDVGVTPHHAYYLCATDSFVEENPGLVRDFVQATALGYEFARDNPQEALEILAPTMCNTDPDILRNSLEFMTPTWFAPNGKWGFMDEDLMRSYAQWMADGGFCDANVDSVAQAHTNEFLES